MKEALKQMMQSYSKLLITEHYHVGNRRVSIRLYLHLLILNNTLATLEYQNQQASNMNIMRCRRFVIYCNHMQGLKQQRTIVSDILEIVKCSNLYIKLEIVKFLVYFFAAFDVESIIQHLKFGCLNILCWSCIVNNKY